MKNLSEAEGRSALVPVRPMVGFGFAAHGLAKLGRGPEKFAVFSRRSVCLRHTWRRGRRRFSSSPAASA